LFNLNEGIDHMFLQW